MPVDEEPSNQIVQRCEALTIPPIGGAAHGPIQHTIRGKIYNMDENRVGMKNLQVCFEEEKGFLCYDTPRGAKKLAFGMGKYTKESFPESYYPWHRLGCPANWEYRCVNCGAWIQENILAIRTQRIDVFVGNLTIVLSFVGDDLTIYMFNPHNFSWMNFKAMLAEAAEHEKRIMGIIACQRACSKKDAADYPCDKILV